MLVDSVTKRIVHTLIQNPTIAYNKSQLIEASDVSRSAFYKRFKELRGRGVIKPAEVEAGHQYWTLNSDSDAANALATLLYPEGDN